MPFYEGTKRVLLGVPQANPFLPQAGPFANAPAKRASQVPNRTISGFVTLAASRRATPLEYNTLTLNSAIIAIDFADMCTFLRANRLVVNGTCSITLSGENGYSTGAGGRGAAGGGGGGGSYSACFACSNAPGGSGGSFGDNGSSGDSGDVSSGKPGGAGVGNANWGPCVDGYRYQDDLGGIFSTYNQPFLNGGGGGYGGYANGYGCFPYDGGNGGASAGLLAWGLNTIVGSGVLQVTARGGGLETSGDGALTGAGGDGGAVLFYTKAYPRTSILNGHIDVSADSFGINNGEAQIFKINNDNSITLKSFGTSF